TNNKLPNVENGSLERLGEDVYSVTQTPQVYLDHQVKETDGNLVFNWDAVEEIFPKELLDDMFAAYCRFLNRLAFEEELWQAKTRQLLPLKQLEQISIINTDETKVIKDTLLHTLFFEQVALHPHNAAVATSDRTITYQELGDRAKQLGRNLRQLGVRPNQLVAIVMEKGWEQIAATLGILASGAAYVPIDPKLPNDRRLHLLEEAEVQYVLTQSWLDTALEWSENIQRLCIDTIESSSSYTSLPPLQQPSDLAYVIYTSGSTGKPKGVMIDHRGAVNTILDINQRFNVQPQDRIFALSSLSFDLSVYDIFGTLAAGGTIVIPNADATKDPAHWLKLMAQQQVSVWNSVPALMQMLADYTAGCSQSLPKSLRLAMLSGDWLPLSLPDQIQTLGEDVQVVSLGGATEASIWSIIYPIEQVDPTWKSIPYGRPMANQNFYVFNELLEPCPVWVPGQLYIGGIGLAKGYWKNSEKTNASFIIHPQTQERLYKTGDLGRYLPDGNIEFIGREDFQVKVNGHRIELGEIETTLQQHPGIKEVIVNAVGELRGNKQLVAYVIPNQKLISDHKKSSLAKIVEASEPNQMESALIVDELRDFLQQKLPNYMVPAAYLVLDALPLTNNGKVNRRELPEPEHLLPQKSKIYVMPQTESEQIIASVWQEILQLEKIGIHDNFFELGGNSLLMVKTQVKLQEILGREIPIVEMFKSPTVDSFAKYLSQKQITKSSTEKGNERGKYRSTRHLRQQKIRQKHRLTN
ncbi:MAG: amino acid adenylation domain-containing protein, partial [Cyanobacteria bacterium P01_E01_bin.35]